VDRPVDVDGAGVTMGRKRRTHGFDTTGTWSSFR
jgi:hypothetical protein